MQLLLFAPFAHFAVLLPALGDSLCASLAMAMAMFVLDCLRFPRFLLFVNSGQCRF